MHQKRPPILGLAVILAVSLAASSGENEQEAHLVSIYEGFGRTADKSHDAKARVHVDRPGKQVTLILTSYSRTLWQVSVSPITQLQKVILGGYECQAIEGLPASTEIIKAWRGQSPTPLYFSYKPVGRQFRQLVRQVHALTRSELASFHGAYRAPSAAPFVIDRVQNDPQLAVDYPQPTPVERLPAEARSVTFSAHHYTTGRHHHDLLCSFGQYTVRGPVPQSLRPLPDRTTRITYDPVGKVHYGISGHGVVEVNLTTNEIEPLDPGPDVPRLSWPCEITYDTKRNRLILGSSGGGGYLYAYSPFEGHWSVISKRPGALDAFTYSSANDCLYGVLFEYTDEGHVPSLAKVNSHGAIVGRIPLDPPIHPGSLATGPGVCTTQVAMAGKYVAILAAPGGLSDRDGPDAPLIYLVDPEKGKVWLTGKEPTDLVPE